MACERARKRVMYYYSSVESGETCVRASRAAPLPAPPRSPADHMFVSEARAGAQPLTASRALVAAATPPVALDQLSARSSNSEYRSRVRPAAVRCAMDLLCEERVSPSSASSAGEPAAAAPVPRAAGCDPVLLRRRVLDNLLRAEERYAVTANYFATLQTEITPHMRRLVAEWMLEVSAPARRKRTPHLHRPFAILSSATCSPAAPPGCALRAWCAHVARAPLNR